MDYQHFKTAVYKADPDLPARAHAINMATRVLNGSLYEALPYPFHVEKNDAGEYIPLRTRRPSVRYNLCRIVVDDSVSLLFGDGHFPSVECKDEPTRDMLAKVIEDSGLKLAMVEAATQGATGSVAIVMRVLSNRLFWSVMPTAYLTPTYSRQAPDTLDLVREQYKVVGSVLRESGYSIPDDKLGTWFWFRRDFTAVEEVWYQPVEIGSEQAKSAEWPRDQANTTRHSLGFVPVVWMRNLPAASAIDGAATFPPEAVDTMIELDYQLSQGGRALKYQGDPTLMIREPAVDNDGNLVRSAGNAVVVGPEGDAKLLEIGGSASAAVLEYVRACRELALEQAHGNRSNADKLSAAQSGRAMELLNQSLIWLTDKLRTSYGDRGLLPLLRMVIKAAARIEIRLSDGSKVDGMSDAPEAALSLRWPHWYAPTYTDKQAEVTTLNMATGGRQLLSQETAVKSLASSYDVADPEDELRAIEADGPTPDQAAKEAAAKAKQQPPQPKEE
ncbi:hypothetical protein [uncultured Aquabacterium sp.]|uniref:hypothetical protein n=1 Tax=uncultured Aquabacterium sp. TaxID=158753 RepID=UPI0025D36415|nr:hypothetical protein [uncultured Aquabacterium sp.]